MRRSESIKELAIALAKFNGKVTHIKKDATNPQFRSAYVTLDTLIDETRGILQEVGLSVMQFPLTRETGEIGVVTMIIHESGEFIESEPLFMTPTRMVKGGGHEVAVDPQAAGSTISYLRRYSYQAILNLNTGEDDDGNKGTGNINQQPQQEKKANLSEAQVKRLYGIAGKKGYSADKVKVVILKKFNCEPNMLNKQQYDQVVSGYEGLEDKQG